MPFSKLEVSWHHMFKTCLNLAMCKGMEDTSPVNVPDRLSLLLAYHSSRAGCSQALLPLWIGRMLADSERLVVKNRYRCRVGARACWQRGLLGSPRCPNAPGWEPPTCALLFLHAPKRCVHWLPPTWT